MPVVRYDFTHVSAIDKIVFVIPVGYLFIQRGPGSGVKVLDLAKKSLYG